MLLAPTCFVIWSAATAASATIARPIHWRRSADSERSATEMARNASVRSTGRTATRRSTGRLAPLVAALVVDAESGPGDRLEACLLELLAAALAAAVGALVDPP